MSKGTSACPICGRDTPHYHSPEQVANHRDTEAWVEESLRQFKEAMAADERLGAQPLPSPPEDKQL